MDACRLFFGAAETVAGQLDLHDSAINAQNTDHHIPMIEKAIRTSCNTAMQGKGYIKCILLRVHVRDEPKTTEFRYTVMEARDRRVDSAVRQTEEMLGDVYFWYRRREPIRRWGCLEYIPEL
jgi:hypothetical protein